MCVCDQTVSDHALIFSHKNYKYVSVPQDKTTRLCFMHNKQTNEYRLIDTVQTYIDSYDDP